MWRTWRTPEGDWIAAARAVVGEKCLISASYDLHGNVSRQVADNLDMFSAYRAAPHIEDFTKLGLHPKDIKLLVVKSGFRRARLAAPSEEPATSEL